MRRVFATLLAAAIVSLPLAGRAHAMPAPQDQPAQQTQAPEKVTFTGDVVLWAFLVNPDKTAEYEAVLAKLKAALQKIERPEAKQQAAGWRVIKNPVPNSDGAILYIHVISPVVAGADYSIANLVYEAFTDNAERTQFYEQYRSSLKQAFFLIQAPIVADMGK